MRVPFERERESKARRGIERGCDKESKREERANKRKIEQWRGREIKSSVMQGSRAR